LRLGRALKRALVGNCASSRARLALVFGMALQLHVKKVHATGTSTALIARPR